jgi:predicted enzyme related to lactoylglutathione lyase
MMATVIGKTGRIDITVNDAEAGARACTESGGKVLVGRRSTGGALFAAIEDPSGAVAALYQAPED